MAEHKKGKSFAGSGKADPLSVPSAFTSSRRSAAGLSTGTQVNFRGPPPDFFVLRVYLIRVPVGGFECTSVGLVRYVGVMGQIKKKSEKDVLSISLFPSWDYYKIASVEKHIKPEQSEQYILFIKKQIYFSGIISLEFNLYKLTLLFIKKPDPRKSLVYSPKPPKKIMTIAEVKAMKAAKAKAEAEAKKKEVNHIILFSISAPNGYKPVSFTKGVNLSKIIKQIK